MSIKVNGVSSYGMPDENLGCCGQKKSLGDPIMMLEGLGLTRQETSFPTSTKTFSLAPIQPSPISTGAGTRSPGIIAPGSQPTPQPSPTTPTAPAASAVPVPPPVESPGEQDRNLKIAVAVGGTVLLAALFLRGS